MPSSSSSEPAQSALFPLTMWSALRDVQGEDESEAQRGLERLANAYWRPLYVFLLKRGQSHEIAADHVQGFFQYLVTGDVLHKARPGEGRFRNFLLVVFRRWLEDGRQRASAAKRGGGVALLSLHESDVFELMVNEADRATPEEAFDQKWALSLVKRALENLSLQWAGKAALFEALKCCLDGSAVMEPYGSIAERLGMTEGAVKTAAYELRKAFAVQVRQEVRATVAADEDVEEELRYLVRLLRQ